MCLRQLAVAVIQSFLKSRWASDSLETDLTWLCPVSVFPQLLWIISQRFLLRSLFSRWRGLFLSQLFPRVFNGILRQSLALSLVSSRKWCKEVYCFPIRRNSWWWLWFLLANRDVICLIHLLYRPFKDVLCVLQLIREEGLCPLLYRQWRASICAWNHTIFHGLHLSFSATWLDVFSAEIFCIEYFPSSGTKTPPRLQSRV